MTKLEEKGFETPLTSWSHNTFTSLALPTMLELSQVVDTELEPNWHNQRINYEMMRGDNFTTDALRSAGFGYVHIQPQYVRTMTIGQARTEEDLSQMVAGFGRMRAPAHLMPDPPSSSESGSSRRSGMVLAWGRVQYEKGFQVLARAIAALRYRTAGVECMIAGRGTYLPELQSQIDLAGAGDLIELPGFLDDNELRAAIHRAGCVAIPSLYEPFGVVALEALAGGAPLIVADTGGLAELVGGTGSALADHGPGAMGQEAEAHSVA